MPALPDLITLGYATAALTRVPLTPGQIAWLPTAITAASAMVRRYCLDRAFTRQVLTREFMPALNGVVRLDQMPVNKVIRVAGSRTQGIAIYCDSARNTEGSVYFSSAGDYATGIVYTGITLDRWSAGNEFTNTLPFASNATFGLMANAINQVGGGWSAQVTPSLVNWPCQWMIGLEVAQGATKGFASADTYSEVLQGCRLNQETGMLSLGYSGINPINSWQWGPDAGTFDDAVSPSTNGRVQVTYDSGFDIIPADVQEGVVETVKYMMERMRTPGNLKGERLREYTWTAAEKAFRSLPEAVFEQLAHYRIHNA